MKPVAANRWLLIAIPALAVAFGLSGCAQPRYVPPPLPGGPAVPAPPPQVSRQVFYVKVRNLNLRACPGMDCPKISMLERNEEVEKVGASEDWFQIRVKRDGRLGWVDSRYLSPT
ncbi:MAG: SH3 domain-containing protein, partial [Desulfobaccales bacterium]